ncbi:Patellin-4 [Platanthera guangdongensis]|uniref:Patellin-4 n=1 Tax=Platanthera guangdongensis TaxID=2320717 RepID=A0ABR2M9D5_9ASPA
MAADELTPPERKALHDLKLKLQQSIRSNQLLLSRSISTDHKRPAFLKSRISSCASPSPEVAPAAVDCGGLSLRGVPLFPTKSSRRLDAVLLRFMRAREFNARETLEMIQRTLRWRREFAVDGIMGEDLDSESFSAAARVDGVDRDGRPVCYNEYGWAREGGVYEKAFGTKEKQERFLRWRVQFMERRIDSFKNRGDVYSGMVEVVDLKDLLCSSMKDLRSTVEKMIRIFQDNYPDFVVKNIFLNVSLRQYTHRALFLPLLASRAESKFVFARPNKVTQTLLKYIAPENIPIQYGGFKREIDDEFSGEDGRVSETFVRGGGTTLVEIPIAKPGVTVVWEVIVVGWEVAYREEFVPDDEGSYRILIREGKKLERTTRNSFYIHEPGRLVLTIKNKTTKKKAIFHRSKTSPHFLATACQINQQLQFLERGLL